MNAEELQQLADRWEKASKTLVDDAFKGISAAILEAQLGEGTSNNGPNALDEFMDEAISSLSPVPLEILANPPVANCPHCWHIEHVHHVTPTYVEVCCHCGMSKMHILAVPAVPSGHGPHCPPYSKETP